MVEEAGFGDIELGTVIDLVKRYLTQHGTVYIYGSRAEGTHRRGSDLDILVVGNEEIPLENLAFFREAAESSNLPFVIDVHDGCTVDHSFRESVLRKGIGIKL